MNKYILAIMGMAIGGLIGSQLEQIKRLNSLHNLVMSQQSLHEAQSRLNTAQQEFNKEIQENVKLKGEVAELKEKELSLQLKLLSMTLNDFALTVKSKYPANHWELPSYEGKYSYANTNQFGYGTNYILVTNVYKMPIIKK